jgi:hypothetical protein
MTEKKLMTQNKQAEQPFNSDERDADTAQGKLDTELALQSLTNEQLDLYETLKYRGREVFRVEISELDGDQVTVVQEGHDDQGKSVLNLKMIATMGTKSCAAAELLIGQILSLTGFGVDRDKMIDRANQAFSMINNIDPQDDVEAMLAAQMVAVHLMSMDCAIKALSDTVTFEGKELNLNYSSKLMRTFTNQIATLDKHRGKGQQKMTVEHVHVNEGGQAIIGNVDSNTKAQMGGAMGGK